MKQLTFFIFLITFISSWLWCSPFTQAEEWNFDTTSPDLLFPNLAADPFPYCYSADLDNDHNIEFIFNNPESNGFNGDSYCGIIYVAKLDQLKPDLNLEQDASLIISGANEYDLLTLIGIEDINNDGLKDLVLASRAKLSENRGEIYVLFNHGNWFTSSQIKLDMAETTPDLSLLGIPAEYLGLPSSITTGTRCQQLIDWVDLNHDGIKEWILGRPKYQSSKGCVCIFDGADLQNKKIIDLAQPYTPLLMITTDETIALGDSISLGDVDKDGNLDLAISSPGPTLNKGRCHLLLNIVSKIPQSVINLSPSPADVTFTTNLAYARLGYTMLLADFNGDGFSDLAAGMFANNDDPVHVFLYYGRPNIPELVDFPSQADVIATAITNGSGGVPLFLSLQAIDFDHDQLMDILCTIPKYNGSNGFAYLCLGRNLSPTIDLANGEADWTFKRTETSSELGYFLGSTDINDDGYDDICFTIDYDKSGEQAKQLACIYGWQPLLNPRIDFISRTGNALQVALHVEGQATEMNLSGDMLDTFNNTWIPFTPNKTVTLTESLGSKTISVEFRNAVGRTTNPVQLSVPLDPADQPVEIVTNYCNPLTGQNARFMINQSEPAEVKISIHTIDGKRVKKIVDEIRLASVFEITWDGTNDHGATVVNGVYLLYVEIASSRHIKKIILEKSK